MVAWLRKLVPHQTFFFFCCSQRRIGFFFFRNNNISMVWALAHQALHPLGVLHGASFALRLLADECRDACPKERYVENHVWGSSSHAWGLCVHTYLPSFPEVSTHVLHSFRLQACPMHFILVQFQGHSFVVANVFFFSSSSMPARTISWRWSWRAFEAFKGEFFLMKLFLGFRWLLFLGEFLMKHFRGFRLLLLRCVFCFCRTNSWQVWIMCEHWLHSSPHCTSASR